METGNVGATAGGFCGFSSVGPPRTASVTDTQILRSTRDPWNIPVRIILVHEQDEIDLKRMRSDVMSESPHKTPPRERSM